LAQPHQLGQQQHELVEELGDAHEVEESPQLLDGSVVARSEHGEVGPVVAREPHGEAGLAVGRVAPEAERHPVVHKVVVPREVLQKRVAQQRHQVAPAAGGAQCAPQQQQVGHRVLEEECVVSVAADVDLDAEAQAGQPTRRAQQCPQTVEHGLELKLVEAVDEGDEVELTQLRCSLHHRAESGATCLLEMVEEEDRAVGQREHSGWLVSRRRRRRQRRRPRLYRR